MSTSNKLCYNWHCETNPLFLFSSENLKGKAQNEESS